jgi:hypothetical protein
MARITLETPGEDVLVGGTDVEVVGTTTGGEVITLSREVSGRYVLNSSFSTGGDTIVLPGNAADYSARIEGTRVILTRFDDEVEVSIPVGSTGSNTLSFDGDDDRTISVVDGDLMIGDQVIVPGEDNDLGGGTGGGEVVLTAGADVVSGSVFEAPRVFTPGGTDQINSLNDDDVLTGTGERNTLNFSFVNDADTGDASINPTLNNIQVVNIEARLDGDGELDLQDSSGVEEINVSGVDDDADLTIDNIQAQTDADAREWDLSVRDSNADGGSVNFLFDEDALDDDDATTAEEEDTVNLTLEDAELTTLVIGDTDGDAGLGVEFLNLESAGDENELAFLAVEDVEIITITGEGDLRLGARGDIVRNGGTAVEALTSFGGLVAVEGSLTTIDATEFEGDLDLVINDEATATSDETSGGDVDLQVLGGLGDDTFRLNGTVDSAADIIDGNEGDDRIVVGASVENGSIEDIELLDIRGDDETITIDATVFDSLEAIWIRNESNNGFETVNGQVTVELDSLDATQAANISVQHGVTLSNGLTDLVIDVDLASTAGAADLVALTWVDKLDDGEDRGINNDPRFNFTLIVDDAAEDVTLNDEDSESNSVLLGNVGTIDGVITLTGGAVGDFLSLDVFDDDFADPIDQVTALNVYGMVSDGSDDDFGTSSVNGADSGHVYQSGIAGTTRIVADEIDGSAYLGDAIVRVGENNQTITLGAGTDTVIFDARDSSNAGLTVADTVVGGAGSDTIAFEGNQQVTIGGSEWLNVSGFETVLLIGNDVAGGDNDGDGFENEFGENAYNIRLTTELLTQNGAVGTGGIRTIHIRNDNDLAGPNDVGGNTGVTIDATPLTSGQAFSYDGAEDFNSTADRFIMSDININGRAVIDGGSAATGTGNGNLDVLEVRATQTGLGAQITDDDLANVRNVSTLEFVNNTANDVTHFLELNNALIDQLVNTAALAGAEVLTIRVYDNPDLPAAETTLVVDLTAYVPGGDEGIAFEGDGSIEIVGFDSQADAEAAGIDFSGFSGDAIFDVPGESLVQDEVSAAGPETFDFGVDTVEDSLTIDDLGDGVDTVENFQSGQDEIIIGGALEADLNGLLSPDDFTTNGADGVAQNFDFSVFLIGDQADSILVLEGETTLNAGNYDDEAFAAFQLEAEINLVDDTAGESVLLVVQGDDGTSAIYDFTSVDADGTFDANELTLLAVVDDTLTTADYSFA